MGNLLGTKTFTRIELGSYLCGPAVPNSSGMSADISALGTGVAGAPRTLAADSMLMNQCGYFLISTSQGALTTPSRNAVLCLGGSLGRFNAAMQIRDFESHG